MIVLGIVLLVIGLLLVIAFLSSRIRCNTQIPAVVVRVIEKKQYVKGRTVFDCTPVFGYTVNSKEYTAKADLSTSDPKKFTVGQAVTIYVDTEHPENIRYGSNAGFCIAGLVLAALGIFVMVLYFM